MLTDKRFLKLTDSYIYFLAWSLLLIGLLLPFTAIAQSPPALQLTPDTRNTEVTPHMALLIDKDASLTIEQVAATDRSLWVAMKQHLSMGFTPAVVWLRLDIAPIQHQTDAEQHGLYWLLEVTQPALTDVRMYTSMPDGTFKMAMGTRNTGMPERAHNHRSALFDLPISENKTHTVYLRLQSSTSMASTFKVWESHAFWTTNTKQIFLWGLMYGFCILVFLFHLVFSFWIHNRLHLSYAIYLVATCSASLVTDGWPLLVAHIGTMEQWLYVLGTAYAITIFSGTIFGILFLNITKSYPTIARIQISMSCIISLVSIGGVLAGHYSNVMPWMQLSVMFLIFNNCVLAVMELRRGNQNALIFIGAFLLFYIGSIIRVLRNRGILEPSVLTENSYQLGAFLHILIISFGIITAFTKLQQEKKAALELAKKEADYRKEQADFLGMVSHELRTPLTIISSAIDNLQSDDTHQKPTRQRIEKISRATHRMQTLVDSFLNAERMNQSQFEPDKNPCKLDVMLQESIALTQERTLHPIVIRQEPNTQFQCQADKQLMRIAFDNILSNAVQHSVKGAPVTVSLTTAMPYFVIQIINQGNPIDEDDLPKIFDRYHRGKNSLNRPGTGLGLHVTHTIARNHGGTLEVTNLTSGCCFTLKIPTDFIAQRG